MITDVQCEAMTLLKSKNVTNLLTVSSAISQVLAKKRLSNSRVHINT